MIISHDQNFLRNELGLRGSFVLVLPFLVVIPILLQHLNLFIIGNSYGPRYAVFELFGFCVALCVVAFAFVQLRARKSNSLDELLPMLAFILFALYFVVQITEYHPKSSDWTNYVNAARDVLEGKNPYATHIHLYPPVFAESLAAVYRAVSFGATLLHMPNNPDFVWDGVFYIYQCCQFFLVIGAYLLSYRFVRSLDVSAKWASLLLLVLFVFNVPMKRTLMHHQVNLWLLDSFLLALVTFRHAPWLGGIAIVIGTNIKLYPAIVLLPFALMKQFRVIVWTFIIALTVFLLQTNGGSELTRWKEFLVAAGAFQDWHSFRDNSTNSLIYNTLHALNTPFGVNAETMSNLVNALVWISRAGILYWFVIRFRERERSHSNDTHRVYAHLLDAFALGLLLSPMVWEHHYVLAIPLALWSVALYGAQKPWHIGIALALMFAIPIFDVFPLSYHRLVGLILLLSVTVTLKASAKR